MLFIHFKTLFSFRFYLRLAQLRSWPVIGFVVYLFLLGILIVFFFTGSVIKKNLPVFLKNFPQVTFENGVLTQPQQPVYAPIPNTDFKIVFDAGANSLPTTKELLDTNTLAWVHGSQLYVPSASGLQIQELPQNLNFTSDQQTIEKYKKSLSLSLRMTIFITSWFFMGLFLLFDYCMALGVLALFNLYKRAYLPKTILFKLAAFLLGPLVTLFLIHLWITIPLFTFAQLIVSIIYTQQIFNALPEIPHEN